MIILIFKSHDNWDFAVKLPSKGGTQNHFWLQFNGKLRMKKKLCSYRRHPPPTERKNLPLYHENPFIPFLVTTYIPTKKTNNERK